MVVTYSDHHVQTCAPLALHLPVRRYKRGQKETVSFTGTTDANVKLTVYLADVAPEIQIGDVLGFRIFFADGMSSRQLAAIRAH